MPKLEPKFQKLNHGKPSTYINHKCRCVRCTAAIKCYSKEYYHRRRKKLTAIYATPEPENLRLDSFAPITFNAFAVTHLACVYLWCDGNGKPLYVGSTESLHTRLSTHNVITAVSHKDTLTIYPTRTVQERRQLEKDLIRDLRPLYNKTGEALS